MPRLDYSFDTTICNKPDGSLARQMRRLRGEVTHSRWVVFWGVFGQPCPSLRTARRIAIEVARLSKENTFITDRVGHHITYVDRVWGIKRRERVWDIDSCIKAECGNQAVLTWDLRRFYRTFLKVNTNPGARWQCGKDVGVRYTVQ